MGGPGPTAKEIIDRKPLDARVTDGTSVSTSKVDAADPFQPSKALLAKLGSIVVHADEMLSANGHDFDQAAIRGLLSDPEVHLWIAQMGHYLPQKR
jgi:hypothetical protein